MWDLNLVVFFGLLVHATLMVVFLVRLVASGLGGCAASSRVWGHDEREVLRQSGGKLVLVCLHGPLFFGVAATLTARFEDILRKAHRVPTHIVVDLTGIAFLDDSVLGALEVIACRAEQRGTIIFFYGAGRWERMLESRAFPTYFADEAGDV